MGKQSSRFGPLRVALFLLLGLALLAGCRNSADDAEFAQFAAALDTGLSAVYEFYANLNERELDLYFELLEMDDDFEVGDYIIYNYSEEMDDSSGAAGGVLADTLATPLREPLFPLEAIETRTRILEELAAYGRHLALLAGSEEPERYRASVLGLEQRLISLEDAVEAAAHGDSLPDPGASVYIRPLSTIVGIVVGWRLESLRWGALKDAVIEAEQPVNTILDGLAADLDNYLLPVMLTWQEDQYTTLIQYYNERRKDRSDSWRRSTLEQIREGKRSYDALQRQKPSAIPRQLKAAHGALVELARSDGAAQDLARLRVELEQFKTEVDALEEALAILKGEKEPE